MAAIKGRLVDRRTTIEGARAQKRNALASTRSSRHDLEGDLQVLEKEQARISARLAAAAGGPDAGPIRQGSGQLIWPVNGPIASPFGMRWGRLHAGIDIAVPIGTPIRAADSGKVVLMGWVGGYGNYTCIAHGGGLSTCYGHQSRFGDLERRQRQQGPGDRLRRLHGPLLRPARALRDPRRRHARQPHELPLTSGGCSPRSTSAR